MRGKVSRGCITPLLRPKPWVSGVLDEVKLAEITVGDRNPAAVFSGDPAIDFGDILLSCGIGHNHEMPSLSVESGWRLHGDFNASLQNLWFQGRLRSKRLRTERVVVSRWSTAAMSITVNSSPLTRISFHRGYRRVARKGR